LKNGREAREIAISTYAQFNDMNGVRVIYAAKYKQRREKGTGFRLLRGCAFNATRTSTATTEHVRGKKGKRRTGKR